MRQYKLRIYRSGAIIYHQLLTTHLHYCFYLIFHAYDHQHAVSSDILETAEIKTHTEDSSELTARYSLSKKHQTLSYVNSNKALQVQLRDVGSAKDSQNTAAQNLNVLQQPQHQITVDLKIWPQLSSSQICPVSITLVCKILFNKIIWPTFIIYFSRVCIAVFVIRYFRT